MYSLPDEYWDEDILKDMGNGLGEYIMAAEETKMRRYTSYARICVFMQLNEALPESVSLSHYDEEWVQPLDYEHVPFRCRKCHALGHLFRDCPLNAKDNTPGPSEAPTQDGFTNAPSRQRAHKKPSNGNKPHQNHTHGPASKNSFEILANASDEHPPFPETTPAPPSSSSPPPPLQQPPHPNLNLPL